MLHPEVLERGDIILPRDPSNPKKKPTVSETIEGYVKLLKTDTAGFLTTKDQLGPNHYAVNFEKLRYNMKKRLFENSITERYGRAVCRIVRILLDKGKMDESQIQKISMLPLKDIRQKLEMLFADGIVEIQVKIKGGGGERITGLEKILKSCRKCLGRPIEQQADPSIFGMSLSKNALKICSRKLTKSLSTCSSVK